MAKDIREYVRSCDVCQKTKHRKHPPYGLLQPLPIPSSVAAGRARPGRGYFLLSLALAGPHFFVRGRPVAWPAVGRVGRAKSGQAGYMAGLALAGLWPD